LPECCLLQSLRLRLRLPLLLWPPVLWALQWIPRVPLRPLLLWPPVLLLWLVMLRE